MRQKAVSHRNIKISRFAIREIGVENISWAYSRGAKNALFSFNLMVILKESLEQNISKNIMATNPKRSLATAQKVITMRIKGRTTRTKMGRVKKRYTQPVSKSTGELTANNGMAINLFYYIYELLISVACTHAISFLHCNIDSIGEG